MTKHPILRRFIKRKSSIIGCIFLALILFMAIFGPILTTRDPLEIDLNAPYSGMTKDHPLGTDALGRDTLARMVYGSRTSLLVSFSGVILGAIAGVLLGLISGYFGGVVDTLISRVLDILMAFPGLLLAILIVSILGNGLENTIIAISIYTIPSLARLVRSLVITLKKREFVQVCKTFGTSNSRILFKHILPNCSSIIIVDVTLSLGTAILTSSSLSFLGLGVQPPAAEWGAMLSNAREALRMQPLAALVPGIAITLVVLSFSMVGDGLRDALDPRLKNC